MRLIKRYNHSISCFILVAFFIFSGFCVYGFRLILCLCDGACRATGYIYFTTFWADAGVQHDALTYYLSILALSLGLLVEYVLHLMSPNRSGSRIRIDSGGALEGDAWIIGAVLVFALLAGFTAAVLCRFLGAFNPHSLIRC